MTELSLVIPTLNAGPEWEPLLAMLRRQQEYADAELVIVDSGSTDGTPETARAYGAKVVRIDPATFNHGETRNLGVRHTSGRLIALLTQDAQPAGEAYLATLVRSLYAETAAGAYARQIPRPDASPLIRRDAETWISGTSHRRVSRLDANSHFHALDPMRRYLFCVFDNVASLIRREVWERLPFPRVPFGEDLEWAYRALCNGYTIVYEPDAAVIHSHERPAEYVYKRTFVDHYRLYHLFGLRTVPTRRSVWRSIGLTTIRDWRYLAGRPEWSIRWIRWMANVPRYAWASAWGQHHGARTAARGVPLERVGGV
ncbi:MAG: glycosyltransferase family 2 protein [bacterium]